MVTFNNYINLFVLQELGDITEGVRLWRIKWGYSQGMMKLVESKNAMLACTDCVFAHYARAWNYWWSL